MNETRPSRLSSSNSDSSCPICSGQWLAMGLARLQKLPLWLERQSDLGPPVLLRLLLAYEFGKAGLMKLHGENWFADLAFPFPFSLLPADLNWWLATGFEIAGPIALLLGWGTRFFSFTLMVLTLVAMASVHWPSEWHSLSDLLAGYAITDQGHGNFKLPVIYLAMLIPLLFGGPGRLSLDYWLWVRKQGRMDGEPVTLEQV